MGQGETFKQGEEKAFFAKRTKSGPGGARIRNLMAPGAQDSERLACETEISLV
jgi:hypothetical protein